MTQDRIYLSPPHLGADERTLLLDALESNWIAPLGPHVDAFEQDLCAFVGSPNAAALSSGTAALHLALIGVGVKAGDDVFVSDLTFAAPANAVTYVGARPVFIDSDADTWTLSPALLAEELKTRARQGKLPKAVITVDLYGQCADYDPILEACAEYDIPVIEDAAEALGATYKGRAAGTLGLLGAFSFNGNKIITCSGGGMLISAKAELINLARHLSTQAREPRPEYHHTKIGYNYRLSNLLAAVARGQLRVLKTRIEQRRRVNQFYQALLGNVAGVSLMPEANYGSANKWLTCILIDKAVTGLTPEQVRVHLEKHNIEARPLWKPMHMQPVFHDNPSIGGTVSEGLFNSGLCLPSGSSLSDADLDRVASALAQVFRLNAHR